MTERFTLSCVELKYLLGSDEIDPFIASLRLEEAPVRRDEWRITTAYLDRENGSFAEGALAHPKSRAELRLREYFRPGGEPISPFVWVESKEWDGKASTVNRFQLHRLLVARFLRGDLEDEEILGCQERFVEPDRVLRAVNKVRAVAGGASMTVSGAATWLRLALEGGDPQARLTVDRDIAYHLGPFSLEGVEPSLEPSSLGPTALEERAGVVEIKYRGGRRPAWCERVGSRPLEYSKFLILSALARSERSAERAATFRRVS